MLTRPKHGFGLPLDRWFRTDLRAFVETLSAPSARLRGYLDADALEDIVNEHMSGRSDHGHSLWTLLTLEVFLQKEGW